MHPTTVYTIGHSNHPLDRLLALLQQHAIELLVDIRRFPSSRRLPHFNRTNLEMALPQRGIQYQWQESLGGHRESVRADSPNGGLPQPAFRNYADHMQGDEFREGITRLLHQAQTLRTAIMCAEGSFRDCHRRLVSDYLVAHGIAVRHIVPTGELLDHLLSAGAQVRSGRVLYPPAPVLFD